MPSNDDNRVVVALRVEPVVAKRFGLMVDMLGTTRQEVLYGLLEGWMKDHADEVRDLVSELTDMGE